MPYKTTFVGGQSHARAERLNRVTRDQQAHDALKHRGDVHGVWGS